MKLTGSSKVTIATATPDELREYPMLIGNAVVVSTSVLTEGWFTSAVVEELEEIAIQSPINEKKLALYKHHEASKLGTNGIVQVGTKVSFNTPLAVSFPLLEGPQVALASHLLDEATVVRSEVKGKSTLTVGIDLLVKRPLCIGDLLADNHGNIFVVAAFSNKGRSSPNWRNTDLLVNPVTPLPLTFPYQDESGNVVGYYSNVKLTKLTLQREDKLEARSCGLYNLLTLAPIANPPAPGQKVNTGLVAATGFVANAREMLTVKCDARAERDILYEALALGNKQIPTTGVSEADLRLRRLLQACGFESKLDGNLLAISRATDEISLELSFGEVAKPDTIDSTTLKPDGDGLMCERIFGPVRDWECSCGKYKGTIRRGIICPECGVEVTKSSVRHERFGHIKLNVPVIHPFFVKLLPEILDADENWLLAILNCEQGIAIYSQEAEKTGAYAIADMLEQCSVDPQPFLLEVLPVLPPEMRPLAPIGNGKFANSDLNVMYRRIIHRNNLLKKMLQCGAPEQLMKTELRMLQNAVCDLMMNSTQTGSNGRTMRGLNAEIKSLVENFFSKRCDYSARAVCIPDPTLPQGILGLPDMILLEIFRPMVYRELKARGATQGVREAKHLVESSPEGEIVLGALDEVIRNYPVLAVSDTNSGVRGFRLARRQGEAICVNPSDANSFGINFSGEQLTIHVPLSDEAKKEALKPPNSRSDMTSTLAGLSADKLARQTMENGSFEFELGELDLLVFSE